MSNNLQDRFKLRFWDDSIQNMVYINDLYWFEENSIHDINGLKENDFLMQSTGLYDKNKKLIYEFDIIQGAVCNNVVVWYKTRWMLMKIDPKCHLCKNNNQKCKYCQNWWMSSGCTNLSSFQNGQVIGNIFENKELISKVTRK